MFFILASAKLRQSAVLYVFELPNYQPLLTYRTAPASILSGYRVVFKIPVTFDFLLYYAAVVILQGDSGVYGNLKLKFQMKAKQNKTKKKQQHKRAVILAVIF